MSHGIPHINQVALLGRLTCDPEFRLTDAGSLKVSFTLAVKLASWDRENEWQDESAFVPVAVFGTLAEEIAGRLQRGEGIFLTGILKSVPTEASDGNMMPLEVVARYIQFLKQDAGEAKKRS